MKALLKLIIYHTKSGNYYKGIKFGRKATSLNELIKFKAEESEYILHKEDSRKLMLRYHANMQYIKSFIDEANTELNKFMLHYFMTNNKIKYFHTHLGFHCDGYTVLKHGKNETLSSKIRDWRDKRCRNCNYLAMKSKKKPKTNKKKKFKRKKCKRCRSVFYCNKYCQKRHWGKHKLVCVPFNANNE